MYKFVACHWKTQGDQFDHLVFVPLFLRLSQRTNGNLESRDLKNKIRSGFFFFLELGSRN